MSGQLLEEDLHRCVRNLPRPIKDLLKRQTFPVFVAGGYIRSTILGEEPNDLDLFVSSKADAVLLGGQLALLYVGQEGYFDWYTANAYNLKTSAGLIQIIHKWAFKTPEECVGSFDFTIASASFWWQGQVFDGQVKSWQSCCDERFYADLASKRLRYRNPAGNTAGGTVLRMCKFLKRGFSIGVEEMGAVLVACYREAEKLDPIHIDKGIIKVLREVDPVMDPDGILGPINVKGDNDAPFV